VQLPETTWKHTLLSLVVIFTQSIQLSKIVELFALLRVAIAPSGGLSIPAQGSISAMRGLNLKQTSLVERNHFKSYGGADRDRTDDILLAKQALSQLSYSPIA
jgi:hypothetical protein